MCWKSLNPCQLSLSKLVRAEIDPVDVPSNVIDNVEFLCMNHTEMDTFKSISMFRNLIHIKLQFNSIFRGWDGVVELLQNCPRLEILFIKKWFLSLSRDWKCPSLALECVLSHLRSCTILNFQCYGNDLRFATYILQNARRLQDMTINITTYPSNWMLLGKRQIIEGLSSYPKIQLNLLYNLL
ncbi:putative FBD domain, leucine-rich repeat domain, L domain-containing protein [Medicago truncatula]|uniref:FBD protein n=1 Tax=Medicago truncatula TaxID=3880 RepID=G7JYY4_MEDTR|nr:FBD protein [Medicago truncatula]RHN54985.1 putative FBD domain, leucine-rich repeat domain, L domain-containing protein [Medicago truncatula]